MSEFPKNILFYPENNYIKAGKTEKMQLKIKKVFTKKNQHVELKLWRK